jgi:hypothetical protein
MLPTLRAMSYHYRSTTIVQFAVDDRDPGFIPVLKRVDGEIYPSSNTSLLVDSRAVCYRAYKDFGGLIKAALEGYIGETTSNAPQQQ